MLVGELANSGHPGITMSGLDYPDSGSMPGAHNKPRRSSLVRAPEPETSEHVIIEPEYYMSNYEATVTVHKSPPMARRPVFDFLEIDDETRDFPALGLHRRKAPKKNLKVTFSDHIEVDIISLVAESDDSDNELSVELLDPWNSHTDTNSHRGVHADTTSYKTHPSDTNSLRGFYTEINSQRSLGSPEPSKSVGRRPRPQVSPSRKKEHGYSDVSPGRSSQATSGSSDSKPAVKSPVSQSQPLLQRRKQTSKPSLVSDSVQQKITALSSNSSPPSSSSGKRFSRSVFPDIVSSLRSDKPTVTGVKRVDASSSSRSYERPWLTNSTPAPAYQQNLRLLKQRTPGDRNNSTVRRTTSLPKNFKLPDGLPQSRFAKGRPDSPRIIRS